MSFEEFQDCHHGGHLGYRNGTILAILNRYIAPMLPIVSAQSDLWFGRRCRLKNFRIWISECNDFSNSESLCHCDASHQVSTQSNLRFGRRCRLKNFKMAILDIGTERF